MTYSNLNFPLSKNRPFFYTSFVSTIDGKVWIDEKGYWPIGSRRDHEFFTFLRAHADAIIDGKNTAIQFGNRAIDTFNSTEFRDLRKSIGKSDLVKYIIVTKHPDEKLRSKLENKYNYKPAVVGYEIEKLVKFLKDEKLKTVFINGGPTFLAALFEKNLIDELFLTVAPKIVGSQPKKTLTLVEGKLFPPNQIKRAEVVSIENVENEIFIRYKIKRSS